MANELLKTANEKIWYPVGNYNLVIQDDETIESCMVNVFNSSNVNVTATLISGTPQIIDKKVFAFIVNGVSGQIYTCKTLATTSDGNKYEAIGRIKVI